MHVPYGDVRYDIEKFCFFDKAVLSMLKQIDFCPDIIHCHDWQTGLIPVYLKNEFQADSFYWGMKSYYDDPQLKVPGSMGYQDHAGTDRIFSFPVYTG